jgi:tetratricopeptide (TPR) repeat protein
MNIFTRMMIACLLMGAVASCGSSEDSAAKFVESGKALLIKGEVDKARLEFKNAIQVDPRMAEPFYQLALIDEKQQKWKSMFANLTTVEQLAPDHYEAIVKLGQIYLLAGNFDLAMEKADKLLQADSQNVKARVLLASILLKQKNFGSALEEANQALALDKNNMEAISVKVLVYKDQGNADEALKLVDEAIKNHEDALPLKMIKLGIFESQKDYAAMEAMYRDLLPSYPDKNWVAVSLAKLLNNALDRYEDAKKVLEDYIATDPEDKEVKLLLVSLVQTKEPKQAISLLDSYIKAEPNNYDLRFAKLKLLAEEKEVELVTKELQQIIADDSEGNNGLKAKGILAGIEAGKGNFEQAEALVDQVLEVEPEDETALLLKVKLELRNNEINAAISNLRLVLRNQPDSDQALVMLAQAHIRNGSPELAEDNFRKALDKNPTNPIAALAIANSLMKANKPDRAEDVLVTALKENRDQESLLKMLVQIRILKKDWIGSKSAIETLQTVNDDSALYHYLMGQMYLAQEENVLAIDEYKLALSENPDMDLALQNLALAHMNSGEKQALIDYLKQFIQKNPKQINGYSVLATIYQQEKSWDLAKDVLEKGLAVDPKWTGGYGALAAIAYANDEKTKAIDIFKRGLSNSPENNYLSLQLASAYELVDEFTKAKMLYEEILARDENIEPAINNLASLLTDQFESAENLKKALELSSRFKNATEPYYMDTYAWVNVKLGNLDEAQSMLERVVLLNNSVAIFNYHLGVLYNRQGNVEQAKEYLETANRLAIEQKNEKLSSEISKVLEAL